MTHPTPTDTENALLSQGGVETPQSVTAQTFLWLESLSPELAHDVRWMESVESWRVDQVPGPWLGLFKWLTRSAEGGQSFSPVERDALLNFLGYIGSANALLVMARAVDVPQALDDLLQQAVDRQKQAQARGQSVDPVAQVTIARVRRLFTRQLFTRVFSAERRAEVLNIVLSREEEMWGGAV